jgi:putative flippase GtrA
VGVGAVVLAVDLCFFFFAISLWPHTYLQANIGAKVLGAGTGFLLHSRITFSGKKRRKPGWQAVAYVGVIFANVAITSLLLYTGVEMLGLSEALTKIVAEIFVVMIAFFANRHLVFAQLR